MSEASPSSAPLARYARALHAQAAALLHDARGTTTTEATVLFVLICVLSLIGWQYMGEVIVMVIEGD